MVFFHCGLMFLVSSFLGSVSFGFLCGLLKLCCFNVCGFLFINFI